MCKKPAKIAATLGNATTGALLKKCFRFHGEVGKNVPLGQQAEREEKARATESINEWLGIKYTRPVAADDEEALMEIKEVIDENVGKGVFVVNEDNTVEINAKKEDHPKFDAYSGLSVLEIVLTALRLEGYSELEGA